MNRRLLNPDTASDLEVRRILDDPKISGFTMIAGAGSGKTTSLVKALDHVIATRGKKFLANRQQVACVTYTEIAKQEIEGDLAHNPIAHVATIHSFLWTLIEPFQLDIRLWVQEYGAERLAQLESELAGLSSRVGPKRRAELSRSIARLRNGLARVDTVTRFRYGVARSYGEGIVGHDDILRMVPELIVRKPLFTRVVSRRFPLVFVDESQDTFERFVRCLRHVAIEERDHFCLGFFGDPMQKIYMQGVGDIAREDDWEDVQKPENFRSPLRILDVINGIRVDGDNLVQVSGLPREKQREGEVTYFVFPADDRRMERLERARVWLAANSGIGAWQPLDGADSTKILVITHRMAARRLGFENLYDAFHGSRLSDDFDEGRAWPLRPFVGTILPLAEAARSNRAALLPMLRRTCPILQPEALVGTSTHETLKTISKGLDEVLGVLNTGGPDSIRRALNVSREYGLIELDDRLAPFLIADEAPGSSEESDSLDRAINAMMKCDVTELNGYWSYIGQQSPYSTHQGVKGAEYKDVLVVLDDEEGRHFQFSYDKLFGLRPLSPAERARQSAGEDTTIDRTRRLLYVCASRATEALAIVLIADDVDAAITALNDFTATRPAAIVTAEVVDAWSAAETDR
ncbi:DNA helicase-2/ATP-dependent DNA helicase PcrA [Kribbella sp. VKM Ac-2527]|uniref:DNA helicase-2/ATP-dependent DNA helicase PcrA n=1 Tax=Kribbella caucasensis TaxID=2512215 RepID=A0A4R6KN87_9ACTN|nr:UvrD-helicase domain-containing protein [Kribbella sp. VKM Ac-2527]TDO51560.1 DNA helicase-2/ATP-dependent DNA helicase PcrA [Kribbella sp. VKM Ac-2527]